ncbi:cupin domain-containing protein [Gammaproteobacteria bacterium]|nr:cupin domain-containing protein [Gammaproteobacteria bacterium]
MKIVTMIPARLGSTRVKNKNIRLLDSKPLIQHIIDTAKSSSLTGEIYLNSESEIFEGIALENNINFYKRDPKLSSDEATNDDFSLDFMNNIECDVLLQLLPTSPFITSGQIDEFLKTMIEGKFQTMISTANVQIEALYKDNPINFDQKSQTPPSQLLSPIQTYACGIMAWDCKKFRDNMDEYGAGYHGGEGSVGFYELKGFATIDIDNEEDFVLAEAVIGSLKQVKKEPEYYEPNRDDLIADANVKRILISDGVISNNQDEPNKEKVMLSEIIEKNGRNSSWSHTIVDSSSNSATLIGQLPGEGNRKHFHPDWNEWWYILEGQWNWNIDGEDKIITAGEVVFIKRGKKHQITASGDKMAVRLAVSRYDVDHIYEEENYKDN